MTYTNDDVDQFLENDLRHLERCDLADDHPFANPWHDGSWMTEAVRILRATRAGEFPNIIGQEHAAFLKNVYDLAISRGYADGGDGEWDGEEASR